MHEPNTCQVIGSRHHSVVTYELLRTAVGRAFDLALPPTCAGCGAEGQLFCNACRPSLESRLERPGGLAIGLVADIPRPLLQLEWCSPFVGPVRKALHALKYAGERRLAEPLGAALATRWRHAGAGGDVMVPVPIHADRARERGYDQAVLLAAIAARDLGLPLAAILERHRPTERQFDLDRRARSGNVVGAFRLVSGTPGALPLDGRWAVLVDDVVTTGSTLVACASVLMAAGAIGVSALTVARER